MKQCGLEPVVGSVEITNVRAHENKGNYFSSWDRLCGLVVRVSGYRYRGPGFDPRCYQIF